MPLYRVPALDPRTGKTGETVLEADSPELVVYLLRERGQVPLGDPVPVRERRTAGLPAHTLATIFRQLASLLRTGRINPPQALELLGENIPRRYAAKYAEALRLAAGGETLAHSLRATGLFPGLAIAMVDIGERTGKLEEIFAMLYAHYFRAASFARKLRGALTYPIFVVLLALGITWGLMVFVVPKFASILADMDAELPRLTQAVVGLSHFLASPLGIGLVLAGLLGLWQGVRWFWSHPQYRLALEPYLLRMPVVGPLLRYSTLATFARTFALMHRAGIQTYEVLEYIRRALGLAVYAQALGEAKRGIATQGASLHGTLSAYPQLFPKILLTMVRIGEETGQLDDMLDHAAATYEEEAESILTGISGVVEPILLILVGGMVGTVMLSVLLPYFAIASKLGGGF